MISEKQDRRVKRSKALMRDALIGLMKEKPFSEITAKDITDRADLNRATFYLHYNNVFGLLDELENEAVEGFSRMLEKAEIRQDAAWEYPLIGHICDYIVENPDLCRCLLLNPRSDRLAEKLTEIMKQKGQKVRQEMGLEVETHRADYIHQFIACGAMGMVKQWLVEGMPLSKEEMMDLAEKMVRPIFQILIPS
ncbi:MAG: TetR-like C-terminal domain-containing protein [Anaerotignum sp.]